MLQRALDRALRTLGPPVEDRGEWTEADLQDFASDLVCKYHGAEYGYGKYTEQLKAMTEALRFVTELKGRFFPRR